MNRFLIVLVAVFSLSQLAACDTAEDRAEKHFQSAMELLEQGDQDRAIVEFRNVFKLNGQHRDARAAYANLQRERGNIRESMGQYLRLVEQYPEDFEGRKALAELSFSTGNWSEMVTNVSKALELKPDDQSMQALQVAIDYQGAIEDDDDDVLAAARKQAFALREKLPTNVALRQVIIDDLMRTGDSVGALDEVDRAIEQDPNDRSLYQLRLSLLAQLRDTQGIEDHLIATVEKFPDEPEARSAVVRWFVSRKQFDQAEAFLRDAIDPTDNEDVNLLTLIRFLAELRGPEAAIAEIDNAIANGNDGSVLAAVRAGLVFEKGEQKEAIAALEDLANNLEPSEERRRIKVALAKMLIATGNSVGARANVEEVLAADRFNVEALKMKSGWQIDSDRVGEAIVGLRSALESAPNDPEVMTLMARAYERNGDQELVGEMLSLAVGASNAAPEESVRYANFLMGREKFRTAEEILIDSLRLSPNNPQILVVLGQLYAATEDWSRAEQVAETLLRLPDSQGQDAGNSLKASLLQLQNKTAEAIDYLAGLVSQGEGGTGAHISIVRSYLSEGNVEAAQSYVSDLLAETPDDEGVRFIAAAVAASSGDWDGAEAEYRKLLSENPRRSQVWVALFRLLSAQNKTEEANAAIDAAIAQSPEDSTLLWIKAGILERGGDISGAVEIYRAMYDKNSENLIIANNLASLMTAQNEDPETVESAFVIARRLRGSEVPPYQDTFGWIALLRGDVEVSLESLEPAAAALVNDPTVQYHLARAYSAAERNEEAMSQYQKVLGLTGEADTREFVVFSRAEIARLNLIVENEGDQ